MALVRLANLTPARDVAGLVRKLEELERRLAGGALPASPPGARAVAPPPPPPAAPPDPGPAPEVAGKKASAPAATPRGDSSWPGLVEFVRTRRRPVIASILEQASPLAIDLPLLHLGLPKGSFALGQLEDRDYFDALTQLAGEYFGVEVRIKVSTVEAGGQAPPSLAAERAARESDRTRRLKEDALAHPMVKAAEEIFGARVEEVRPIDKGFV